MSEIANLLANYQQDLQGIVVRGNSFLQSLTSLHLQYQRELAQFRIKDKKNFRLGHIRSVSDPILSLTQLTRAHSALVLSQCYFEEMIGLNYTSISQILQDQVRFFHNLSTHRYFWVLFQDGGNTFHFEKSEQHQEYAQQFLAALIRHASLRAVQSSSAWELLQVFKEAEFFCTHYCPWSWEQIREALQNFGLAKIEDCLGKKLKESAANDRMLQVLSEISFYTPDTNLISQLSNLFGQAVRSRLRAELFKFTELRIIDLGDDILDSILQVDRFYQEYLKQFRQCQFYHKVQVDSFSQVLSEFTKGFIFLIEKTIVLNDTRFAHKLIACFQFLHNNQLFLLELTRLLQSRYLNQALPQITELELAFVDALAVHGANVFPARMIMKDVSDSQQYSYRLGLLRCDYLVLTSKYWNLSQINSSPSWFTEPLPMQAEAERCFIDHYRATNLNRELQILYPLSKVSAQLTPSPNCSYTVHLYYSQYLMLKRFNSVDRLEEKELDSEDLERLVSRNVLILKGDGYVYFNSDFRTNAKALNFLQKRFVSPLSNETELVDQIIRIQSYIVKLLKNQGTIDYSQLVSQLKERFPSAQQNLKFVIEELIEKSYLKRSEEQINQILYCLP